MAKQPEKTKAEIYREERKARLAKASAKKQKKANRVAMKKSTKTAIAVIVVIALVAGIAGFALSKSGIKYKRSVLTIEGIGDISAAEYSVYYRSLANNYFQTGYYYGSSYGSSYATMFTGGYDYTQSPDAQEYGEELEGYENPTWADFFDYSAKNQILNVKVCLKLAEEKGLTLDDDDIASIDEQIASFQETADENNYTLGAYLKANYGEGVTKSLFRTILEEQTLVSKYEETLTKEFTDATTDKEILAEYNEDTSAYDKVGIAYYLVEADKEKTTDDDGNESEAVTKKTMKAAKKAAEKLAENKTVKALSKAVDKYDGESGALTQSETTDSSTISSYVNSDVAEWIYGKGISKGDTKVFEVENTGYYVCMVLTAPYREDRPTIDVRHILIDMTEEDSDSSDDTSTDNTTDDKTDDTSKAADEDKSADVPALDTFTDASIDMSVTAETATDKEAYEKAELILREYLNGDRTEERFGELANANSTDTGSNEAGGLYEEVAPGAMLETFDDWCFDPDRKAGDVGIVETVYGYHIMYFVETNEDPEWKASIKSHLAEHELEDYLTENVNAEKYPITITNEEYIDKAISSTISLLKRQIQSLSSSSSLSY